MTVQKVTSTIKVTTHAKVLHCGRVWDLGCLDRRWNPQLWRYRLHHRIHHRKER